MMGEEDLNPLGFFTPPAGPADAVDDGADGRAARRRASSSCSAAPGSNRIRSAILQTIVGVVDHGLRRRATRSRRRALHFEDGVVYAEPGIDVDALRGARARPSRRSARRTCSSAACQAVERDPAHGRAHRRRRPAARRRGGRGVRRRAARGRAARSCAGRLRPALRRPVRRARAAARSPARSCTLRVTDDGHVSCNGGALREISSDAADRRARDRRASSSKPAQKRVGLPAAARLDAELRGPHRRRHRALRRQRARPDRRHVQAGAARAPARPGPVRPAALAQLRDSPPSALMTLISRIRGAYGRGVVILHG